MKVLLLQNVKGTGLKGEIKNVADGYALNMLIPRGLAKKADENTIKTVNEKVEAKEARNEKEKTDTIKNLNELSGQVITISETANEKGHLYKAIDVKRLLGEIGTQKKINLKEKSVKTSVHFKEVGEYEIELEDYGKKVKINLEIISK